MIRYYILATLILSISFVKAQGGNDPNLILKGPVNTPAPNEGVIDGVVVKDELPVRSKIEYEHVRLADYVWSKRIFSRIDSREKANHPLFYPYDKFLENFTDYPPASIEELMRNKDWVRHQERLSLWTVIMQHMFSGDLSMYLVSDSLDFNFAKEDGYSLKYLLQRSNSKIPYYSSSAYKTEIDKRLGTTTPGKTWLFSFQGDENTPLRTNVTLATFEDWVDNYKKTDVNIGTSTQWEPGITDVVSNMGKQLRKSWDEAMVLAKKTGRDTTLELPSKTYFLTSDMITAYNIKEDWFFDKERSMLDKRIISIAPVARFSIDDTRPSKRGELIVKKFDNSFTTSKPISSLNNVVELEMFWLYFPQLRNVMVNYYVYNNQSDAQWMSFDDFFWKRMFTATIYRASDQFDREIEDYRYGVDALYEAEKIKETMRTWETDLWNY
jgi:hypothetical protein